MRYLVLQHAVQCADVSSDAFNYLAVVLSIIVGFGVTQILAAGGRLIRWRAHVVPYWPPLVWAALLLVIYVQVWWSMFGLRGHCDWTFGAFFVVLLQTLTLYMMAALVLPESVDERGIDLREHYERHAGWINGFLCATVIVSAAKEVVLQGHLPRGANLAFHALLLGIGASAIVVRRPRYHQALTVVAALCMAVYIVLLFWRLDHVGM
jgi:hypothetical protein